MSSVSPQASTEIAEEVHKLGARMLDAPVSGSVPQVQTGTLAIMAGGDDQTFQAAERVLADLGQTVTHVGTNGSGVLMKLAINISLAVQVLAFSEGLLIAERGGIDPALAAQVMSSSSIGSPMLRARVPMLLNLPPDAWFTIRLMAKDIAMAQDEAQRHHLLAPTAIAAGNVLARASELGYAGRDIAAMREVLDRMSAERTGND
jgi:3-hydroxyisobutyrate dehydrogenase-like beta-hydroxyacid dehydrogenase